MTGSRIALSSLTTLIVVLSLSCDSCDQDDSSPTHSLDRPVWLRACVRSPSRLLSNFRSVAGASLGLTRTPTSVDQLASGLLDIDANQLEESIDWGAPALVMIWNPGEGRSLREGIGLRLRRPVSRRSVTGSRSIETSEGQIFLHADGVHLYAAFSEWALAGVRGSDLGLTCELDPGASQEAVEATVEPGLIASDAVKGWVARQGAWLEASARQGTARHGRSDLGDPETAARRLARWGEARRARLEASAPLKLNLQLSAEALHLDLEQTEAEQERRRSPSRAGGHLSLIAPDAYLALTSHNTDQERRRQAAEVVGTVAQVAGDRMPAGERDELDQRLGRLAETVDGWLTLALRPALQPGPVVALAALESRDAEATAAALDQVAELLTRGYLGRALELLGARVTIAEREANRISFAVTSPAEGEEESGSRLEGIGRLLGPSPSLAWRLQSDLVLIAFGPEASRELSRLSESAAAEPTSSILTQPTLAQVAGARPEASLLAYGWAPAVMGILTQGGPSASGLPPGGFALAVGSTGDHAEKVTTVRLDRAQIQSLLRWLTGRRSL